MLLNLHQPPRIRILCEIRLQLARDDHVDTLKRAEKPDRMAHFFDLGLYDALMHEPELLSLTASEGLTQVLGDFTALHHR